MITTYGYCDFTTGQCRPVGERTYTVAYGTAGLVGTVDLESLSGGEIAAPTAGDTPEPVP